MLARRFRGVDRESAESGGSVRESGRKNFGWRRLAVWLR
jgi:hypothetical protein